MENEALSIVDKRTEKTYEIPIKNGTIRAMDLRQIKTGPDDFGLMTYDPAFMNTASCQSSITFIDGDKGILLDSDARRQPASLLRCAQDRLHRARGPAGASSLGMTRL